MNGTDTAATGRAGQTILIVDDDPNVVAGLSSLLEREGRTLITCSDVEASRLVLEQVSVSHVVSDVCLSGPFAYEGLDFVNYVARKSPECRIVLMSGDASAAMRKEARSRGALDLLRKPFGHTELEALLGDNDSDSAPQLHHVPSLDEILHDVDLRPHFQPLFNVSNGRTELYGYEALIRFRPNLVLKTPDALFRYAELKQRIVDLDLRCVELAMATGAALTATAHLFLNVHPLVLGAGGRLSETLRRASAANDLPLDRIVVEITEQSSILNVDAAMEEIAALRELGVRFALDDVGMAYSHLKLIERIKPSFLKISQEFGTACEADGTREKIVRNIISLAHDFNAAVVLEGIEEVETLRFIQSLGVKYAQGYFLGRPQSVEKLVLPMAC
jgi:EAL domain-containing protein (putative c-di-GMP-specific phosphodiesterase class I)